MVTASRPYERVTAMLDSISWRGIKPGLERTRALLHGLGDPDRGLGGVLVAGTNGKGTVCALVESAARAAGLRTVMLTKPHLWSYTERFVIDGTPVTEDGFATLLDDVSGAAGQLPADLEPTAFEMLTAAGILCAARVRPDLLICEVGLGGRLDSTNVLDLGIAVVTSVDLDHRHILGDTVAGIAREKAAIIKAGDVAVTAATPPALEEVVARATEVGARLTVLGRDRPVAGSDLGWDGVRVATRFAGADLEVRAPLLGAHQVSNVATAVAVCDELRQLGWTALDREAVTRGTATVRWPGRVQWIAGSPGWLVDGAHNPAATAALTDTVRRVLDGRRLVVLFGVMSDKDRAPMIAALRALDPAGFVTAAPGVERATTPPQLATEVPGAVAAPDIVSGMDTAAALAGPGGVVLACGSLYLAGEVLHRLNAL